MPDFESLFFEPLKIELNDAEKGELEALLHEIYKGKPINYEALADFEECKNQLLLLLDYILAFDPTKLNLFARYKTKVSELTNTSASLNIKITLKAAKKSIELSLLAIKKHYCRVDKAALDSLVVNLCYSGAFSNIEYALIYFQLDALAFYINNTKSQLLLELAHQFLLENNLLEHIGNDIHYANGLYNRFAQTYGLKPKEDPFNNIFSDEVEESFIYYLSRKFTVSSFLQLCTTFFPMPPQVEIRDSESFKKLTEFFQIFEKDGTIRKKYLHLYEEEYDDNANITLIPKLEFSLFYMGLLASYLEEKGYLKDLYYRVNDKTFLYTGDALIGVNEDEGYRALLDEELLCPQITPIIEALSLWSQLTAETLLRLYQESPSPADKDRYFTALLKKPLLPIHVLEVLVPDFFDNDAVTIAKSALADYIFSNPYYAQRLELTTEQLDFLAKNVSEKKKKSCLLGLIKADKANYVRSLLSQHPDLLVNMSQRLPSFAAIEGAVDVLTLLHDLKVNLSTFDIKGLSPACYAAENGHVDILKKLKEFGVLIYAANGIGKTPAHFAAKRGKVASLIKLRELGVSLGKKDNYGVTPAHNAAKYGQLTVLEKLHQLNIPLNIGDNQGKTVAHYSAAYGQVAVFEKLPELGVPLDTRDNDGSKPAYYAAQKGQIAILEILYRLGVPLDTKKNSGFTLAHVAAMHGQIEVLEKLHQLNVPLDVTDISGATPAHLAASTGKIAALEKLHRLGIPLDIKDNYGNTPAHWAKYKPESLEKLRELEVEIPVDIYWIALSPSSWFFQPLPINNNPAPEEAQNRFCVIS